jgi:hypothetical protein
MFRAQNHPGYKSAIMSAFKARDPNKYKDFVNGGMSMEELAALAGHPQARNEKDRLFNPDNVDLAMRHIFCLQIGINKAIERLTVERKSAGSFQVNNSKIDSFVKSALEGALRWKFHDGFRSGDPDRCHAVWVEECFKLVAAMQNLSGF